MVFTAGYCYITNPLNLTLNPLNLALETSQIMRYKQLHNKCNVNSFNMNGTQRLCNENVKRPGVDIRDGQLCQRYYSAVVPITGSCSTGPAPGTTSAARWTGETPTRSSGWRSGLDNYRCR